MDPIEFPSLLRPMAPVVETINVPNYTQCTDPLCMCLRSTGQIVRKGERHAVQAPMQSIQLPADRQSEGDMCCGEPPPAE